MKRQKELDRMQKAKGKMEKRQSKKNNTEESEEIRVSDQTEGTSNS